MTNPPDEIPDHLFLIILVDTITPSHSIRPSALGDDVPLNPNKLDSIIARFGTKQEHVESEQVVILMREWVELSMKDKSGKIKGPAWLQCRVTGKKREERGGNVMRDNDDDFEIGEWNTGGSTTCFGRQRAGSRQAAIPSSSSAVNNAGFPTPASTPLSSRESLGQSPFQGLATSASPAGFFGNLSHIQPGLPYPNDQTTAGGNNHTARDVFNAVALEKMCGVKDPSIHVVDDRYPYLSKEIRAAGGLIARTSEDATILVFPSFTLRNADDIKMFHAAGPHQIKVDSRWVIHSLIEKDCQPFKHYPVTVPSEAATTVKTPSNVVLRDPINETVTSSDHAVDDGSTSLECRELDNDNLPDGPAAAESAYPFRDRTKIKRKVEGSNTGGRIMIHQPMKRVRGSEISDDDDDDDDDASLLYRRDNADYPPEMPEEHASRVIKLMRLLAAFHPEEQCKTVYLESHCDGKTPSLWTLYYTYRAFFNQRFPLLLRPRRIRPGPALACNYQRLELVRKAAETWDPLKQTLKELFSSIPGHSYSALSQWYKQNRKLVHLEIPSIKINRKRWIQENPGRQAVDDLKATLNESDGDDGEVSSLSEIGEAEVVMGSPEE